MNKLYGIDYNKTNGTNAVLGYYLKASLKTLLEKLGMASYKLEDEEEIKKAKGEYNWVFYLGDKTITLYDYKETNPDKTKSWHIGSKNVEEHELRAFFYGFDLDVSKA